MTRRCSTGSNRPREAAAWPRSSWGTALAAVVVSRLLWVGVFVAVLAIDFPGTPLLTGIRDHLVSWDAISYLSIAAHGYPAHLDYRDAFLPGFPLVVRAVTVVTRDDVTASWLVNAVAETIALWYLGRLVLGERDRSAATFSVWLLALAPTALFLIAPFSESTFIASAAASLYYARAGQSAQGDHRRGTRLRLPAHRTRADPGARRRATPTRRMATATRDAPGPARRACRSRSTACTCRSTSAMPWRSCMPTSCRHSACSPRRPGRDLPPPGTRCSSPSNGETRSIFAREVAYGLLGLVLCVGMWISSRIPRSLALYCTIAWLMTASLPFWRSQPRYSLALFPVVLLVADLTQRYPRARPAILGASAVLMCAGTWIFAQGRWLG